MRKKYFTFLPLAAMLAFCGCSNEEEVIGNDANPGTTAKECGYIAVNIVQPADRGARAGFETGEYGEPEGSISENMVTDATFFIFTNSKDNAVSKQTIDLTDPSNVSTQEPNTEKIYSAMLNLDIPKEDISVGNIGEIYCVLNAPENIKNLVDDKKNVTKKTLRDELGDYLTNYTTSGKFIMTNSVYKGTKNADGNYTYNSEICGAAFKEDNLSNTAEGAKLKPVSIYVERVVAKVRTSKGNIPNDKPTPDPRNTEKEIKIHITGLEIVNIANNAYLFKNINNSLWPNFGNSVYDATNKRCYWETVPENMTYYENKSYIDITGKKSHEMNKANDVADKSLENWTKELYILPNTSETYTSVLVTAQLLDDNNKPIDLVWMMGYYMTSEEAKKTICDRLNKDMHYAVKYKYITDGTTNIGFADIDPTQLDWGRPKGVGLKSYQAVAQVDITNNYIPMVITKEGGDIITIPTSLPENASIEATEVVKFDGRNEEKKTETTDDGSSQEVSYSLTDVNTDLTGNMTKYFADVFTDGLCYYFVEIDQTPAIGGTGPYYGVVRNHIYDLTLNGIDKIGIAIPDPTEPIVPERPEHDKFSYLSAKVNVLSWRLVSQNVEFNGQ